MSKITYTVDELWEAVYVFVPSFKLAKAAGATLSLTQSLKLVAEICFIRHLIKPRPSGLDVSD
jgi:hypothetical protein